MKHLNKILIGGVILLLGLGLFGIKTLGTLNKNVVALNEEPNLGAFIPAGGIESANNSTTTLLAAEATFTGTGEQNNLAQVGVYSFANTTGTLYFDWSVDGTNWHSFPTAGYDIAANIPEFHTAVKLGRYYRTRYINGSTAQSTFRLSTYFGNDFVPISSPLNQSIALDQDATVVRSIPAWIALSRGLFSDITFINKFGRNADASAGDTIVANQIAIQYPATANSLNVVSSVAADDADPAGDGA
jgi:hypothetical protein